MLPKAKVSRLEPTNFPFGHATQVFKIYKTPDV